MHKDNYLALMQCSEMLGCVTLSLIDRQTGLNFRYLIRRQKTFKREIPGRPFACKFIKQRHRWHQCRCVYFSLEPRHGDSRQPVGRAGRDHNVSVEIRLNRLAMLETFTLLVPSTQMNLAWHAEEKDAGERGDMQGTSQPWSNAAMNVEATAWSGQKALAERLTIDA